MGFIRAAGSGARSPRLLGWRWRLGLLVVNASLGRRIGREFQDVGQMMNCIRLCVLGLVVVLLSL